MHHTPHAPPSDRLSPHLPAGWVPAATRHAHALRQQAIAEVMNSVAGQVRAALGSAWRPLARWRRPAAMVKEQPCHS